jgi:eukaryotic-like serine/threonine-protein kinase
MTPPTAEAPRPLAPSDTDPSEVDALVADMVARWRAGERPPAETYFDGNPELWDRPEAALELIAEELVLRSEFGEPITHSDLARRFPKWKAQVEVLLDCQHTLGPQLLPPRFPEPGDRLGEFHLLSELGRGAHARVYLTAQESLGERAVVLKLGPWAGGEHLSLARLQHTHIVPLYSAHEFPERGLRGLCLPYFGGATLADLFPDSGPGPLSGQSLLAAVREAGPVAPHPKSMGGFLETAAPAEVVCWVGACLADGLQYAHDRGLLHLDLKPSNVLIAADGTPMLLDFHLAHAPLKAGDPTPAWAGGTAGYMAPEQAAAMKAVSAGEQVPTDVDGRADVFALGVLLAELWGKIAAGRDRRSIALADVLTRCTSADPKDRYPTAAALAADLRRHLMHLPLRGVANRSWQERWRKWRKRRPLTLPLSLALAAAIIAGLGLVVQGDRQVSRARASLRDAQTLLDQGRYREAAEASRTGEALLDGVPFTRVLRTRLNDTHKSAGRAQAATDLHALCEQVRPLYAADMLPAELARSAVEQCRPLWAARMDIASRLADQPTPELEASWRIDLLDLGILTAYLDERAAPPGESTAARERALATLAEAEELLGPSGVLYLERARHLQSLGRTADADVADRKATWYPARTAWEFLALGRTRLAAGDALGAATALERCLELDPRSVWGYYFRGVCALRLNQPTEAVAAFSACLALNPDGAWCLYNRGLAFAAAERTDRAISDLERAIARDPSIGPAQELLGRLRKK